MVKPYPSLKKLNLITFKSKCNPSTRVGLSLNLRNGMKKVMDLSAPTYQKFTPLQGKTSNMLDIINGSRNNTLKLIKQTDSLILT
jgi:hypothetical protein